jgi:hypothetical protein
MSDVEKQLRDVLSRHAEAAPSGDTMLSQVRWESGRRRRRSVLVGGAGATLALTVLGVVVLSGQFTSGRGTPPAAAWPDAGEVVLVAGSPADFAFPFTPAEPGIGRMPPALALVAGKPTLRYADTGAAEGVTTVTVHSSAPVSASPAPWITGPSGTVRGQPATMVDRRDDGGEPERVLSWPERPDQWVEIATPTSVPWEALTKYATALTARPITRPGPFTFDLMPMNFVIDNISPSMVTFCPPGVAPSADTIGKIAVLLDADLMLARTDRAVTVDGRAGWISTSDDSTVLRLDQGGGLILTVQLPARLRISEPELLRFAAGIQPTASAEPGQG